MARHRGHKVGKKHSKKHSRKGHKHSVRLEPTLKHGGKKVRKSIRRKKA